MLGTSIFLRRFAVLAAFCLLGTVVAFADQLTLTVDHVVVSVGAKTTVTVRYNYVKEGASTGFGGAGFILSYDNTVATIDPASFAVGPGEFANVDSDPTATGMAVKAANQYDIFVNPTFGAALLSDSKQGIFATFELEITNLNADPDGDDFNLGASAGYAFNAAGIGFNPTLTGGSVNIVKLFNAANATLTVDEDAPETVVDLTGKFTDEAGAPVAAEDVEVTAVTQPANGKADIDDDGNVVYRPNRNFNGTDTFDYTANDGENQDTGTVTVTVYPINDIPELRTTSVGNGWWQEYIENSGLVPVFTAVTVVDADFIAGLNESRQTNYDSAVFYAYIENRQDEDELTYEPMGAGGPPEPNRSVKVTVDDDDRVFHSGVHIGSVEYTEEGLMVTFLGANRDVITPAIIRDLVTDLRFRNDSDAPSDAERVIRVFLDDEQIPPFGRIASHHMSELEVYFVHDSGTVPSSSFLEIEFNTSAAVRSVSVIGKNGATVGTIDQYGNPSGMESVAGLIDVDGWCQYQQEMDQAGGPIPGYCEWEVELKFSTWAAMLAAFPPADGLRIQLNFWNGSTATLDVDISGVPATQPTAPVFSTGVAGTTINVSWANNTGGANATVLGVELEGPEIYDDEDDEDFMTERVGGVWAKLTTSFTDLDPGQYEVVCYAGGILHDEVVVDGVSVKAVWGAASFSFDTVGSTFTVNGTITDPNFVAGRAYADNIEASVHKVDGGGMWKYYSEIEGTYLVYQGDGVWSYTAVLANTLGAGEFYVVQAYLDHNWNNNADLDEPYGQTYDVGTGQVKILGAGAYNINLVPSQRSWTRDWNLIGDAYLYISPVNDPPVNTVLPSIPVPVRYGQTVTADPGDWNDDLDYPVGEAPEITDFAYQWYVADAADGTGAVEIDGQTGASLVLVADLVGKFIAVEVTATDQGVVEIEVPSRAVGFASATAQSAWVQVGKAPLTVTADGQSKTYGAANPTLTYTITGFLYADNEGILDTGVTISTTATLGSPVGGYPITVEDAADVLYDITFQNATLTINRAALTVTANNKAKNYGNVNPALDYLITGFVLEEGEGVFDPVVTISTTAGQNSPVGGYPITVSGAVAANYDISFIGANLTVNPRPIEITAEAKAKTYGEDDPALTYELSAGALVGGDGFSGNLGRVGGENVGTYEILQGSVTAGANYALTYVPANLTIDRADLTIRANNAARNFFQPNSAINYSASFGNPARSGLVGGDTAAEFAPVLEFSTDAVNGSPHNGVYKTMVTISPANLAALPASNYDITFVDGGLVISANEPTRNADNSEAKRLLVVSGRTTRIDLRLFFADADSQYGDQLVFSDLGPVTDGNGNETVDFELPVRAVGIVIFDPDDSVGGETYVDLDFTVKVFDSADPALTLDGTEGTGVATIYLRLIDNQPPVITFASPSMPGSNMGADVVERIGIDEGNEVQVTITATDDDGIGPIDFEYSWDNAEWTNLNQGYIQREGSLTASSALLPIGYDAVSFAEGTKILYVRATVPDDMGVEAVKRWEFTVRNVNLQPTLDDIEDVEVMEDNENGDELTVLLTGVSNGGEDNDPKIYALNSRLISSPITATTDQTDIIASLTLEEVEVEAQARANGDMQTFRLRYTLGEDANGVATITVTVDDGSGGGEREINTSPTIVKTFTITVNPVNDPPVHTVPPSISGTPHVGQLLTANRGEWNDAKDLDWVGEIPDRADGITFAYQWQMSEGDRDLAWSNISGATASTFTPALAQNLKWVRVLVTATDSGIPAPGKSTSLASAGVFVDNAAPVFTAGASITIYGFEFQPTAQITRTALLPEPGFDFTLAATDPDGDDLTWSISAEPGYGTAEVDQDGNVSYEPNLNYYNTGDLPRGRNGNGTGESFVVMVDDGLGGTATITVHVVVIAVNDAPEITAIRLVPYDEFDERVSFSKPDLIAKIEAEVERDDVDDTVFTYGYVWTVERRTIEPFRAQMMIDTGVRNELTTADLFANNLGSAFLDNDKVTVTVTVTDSGGGQEYDEPDYGLPRLRSDTASKQVLLGSPAWFPQVPVFSLLAEEDGRGVAEEAFYEITFALDGAKVVTVVVKVVGDKDYPYPAEYLAAVWPDDYEVKGMRSDRTYEVTRVRKFVGGVWVDQELADNGGSRQLGHPTVTVEEYDAPSITSDQDGVLRRLKDQETDTYYTGDYQAVFSMESVGGYRYTWVGPGTNVEELVLFDADPDGTFPTSKSDQSLVFGNITTPGVYTLTVIPRNPESQFGDMVQRAAAQEVWVLDIDQAEIEENKPGKKPPLAEDWGMTPGWRDDGLGGNEFNVGDPEYVGTLADGQLGVELMLSWNMVPDTQQYYLLLSNAAGVPVREYNRVPVGRLPRVPVLLGVGTYRWQVVAVNAAGNREWSDIAWIEVRGVGDEADAIGLAEDRTPYVVDGVVGQNVSWSVRADEATLELSCDINVLTRGTLSMRVYVTTGTTVVYDEWVGEAEPEWIEAAGATRAVGDIGVVVRPVPGLVLAPNTRYVLNILPRNVVDGTSYIGIWSNPTVFYSGAPAGELNFSAVTGPTFVSGSMVFSFVGSNIAAEDMIEYQVSIRRAGAWINLAAAQMTGAAVAGGNLTLPTAVQAGDSVIVRMRVQRDGVWTVQRLFWGVAPVVAP